MSWQGNSSAATPHDVSVRECLCRGFGQLGYSILLEDRPYDALPWLKDAVAIAEEIATAEPARADMRELRIRSYERLGHAHHWIRQISDSRAAYRRAQELAQVLGGRRAEKQQGEASARELPHQAGRRGGSRRGSEPSRAYFNQAISLCRARLSDYPDESHKLSLQTALNNLARLESAQQQTGRPRRLREESSAILSGIAEADPEDVDKQLRVIVDRYNRIIFERDLGHFAEALALVGPTLTKLLALKRAGKLAAQPRFGDEMIEELKNERGFLRSGSARAWRPGVCSIPAAGPSLPAARAAGSAVCGRARRPGPHRDRGSGLWHGPWRAHAVGAACDRLRGLCRRT